MASESVENFGSQRRVRKQAQQDREDDKEGTRRRRPEPRTAPERQCPASRGVATRAGSRPPGPPHLRWSPAAFMTAPAALACTSSSLSFNRCTRMGMASCCYSWTLPSRGTLAGHNCEHDDPGSTRASTPWAPCPDCADGPGPPFLTGGRGWGASWGWDLLGRPGGEFLLPGHKQRRGRGRPAGASPDSDERAGRLCCGCFFFSAQASPSEGCTAGQAPRWRPPCEAGGQRVQQGAGSSPPAAASTPAGIRPLVTCPGPLRGWERIWRAWAAATHHLSTCAGSRRSCRGACRVSRPDEITNPILSCCQAGAKPRLMRWGGGCEVMEGPQGPALGYLVEAPHQTMATGAAAALPDRHTGVHDPPPTCHEPGKPGWRWGHQSLLPPTARDMSG